MDHLNKKIILASGSPRRKELLQKMGLEFDVLVTDANEDVKDVKDPSEVVNILTERKMEKAVEVCKSRYQKGFLIITADTIVYMDGKILGKPQNESDAFTMLKSLENRWHGVYTGLMVGVEEDGEITYKKEVCQTRVKFKPLLDKQIMEYINTDEPYDKAGSYAIQGKGGGFVEKIEGPYDNVVGLPTEYLRKMLVDL